jgi:archaellum component FlaC
MSITPKFQNLLNESEILHESIKAESQASIKILTAEINSLNNFFTYLNGDYFNYLKNNQETSTNTINNVNNEINDLNNEITQIEMKIKDITKKQNSFLFTFKKFIYALVTWFSLKTQNPQEELNKKLNILSTKSTDLKLTKTDKKTLLAEETNLLSFLKEESIKSRDSVKFLEKTMDHLNTAIFYLNEKSFLPNKKTDEETEFSDNKPNNSDVNFVITPEYSKSLHESIRSEAKASSIVLSSEIESLNKFFTHLNGDYFNYLKTEKENCTDNVSNLKREIINLNPEIKTIAKEINLKIKEKTSLLFTLKTCIYFLAKFMCIITTDPRKIIESQVETLNTRLNGLKNDRKNNQTALSNEKGFLTLLKEKTISSRNSQELLEKTMDHLNTAMFYLQGLYPQKEDQVEYTFKNCLYAI